MTEAEREQAAATPCFKATVASDTSQSFSFFPIDSMPANHPSVQHSMCKTTLSAGDAIPTEASGPYNGAKKCEALSGPKTFYAYGYPKKSTGNPGSYHAEKAFIINRRFSYLKNSHNKGN